MRKFLVAFALLCLPAPVGAACGTPPKLAMGGPNFPTIVNGYSSIYPCRLKNMDSLNCPPTTFRTEIDFRWPVPGQESVPNDNMMVTLIMPNDSAAPTQLLVVAPGATVEMECGIFVDSAEPGRHLLLWTAQSQETFNASTLARWITTQEN
jgi:hypothetical protein